MFVFLCRYCSQREIELYRLDNPVLKGFMPYVYHTVMDNKKVAFCKIFSAFRSFFSVNRSCIWL